MMDWIISQDDEKRMEYDIRMKALRDYNQGMIEAEEKGSNNRALSIAKNLVLANVPIDIIINSTGLSEEEIRTLKQ